MRESGRKQKQEAEEKRRRGTEYGKVLEEMGKTRGRKSVSSAFDKYCHAMFSSLGIRSKELLSTARTVARWMHKRKMASFIGKICDKLFDRASLRVKKNLLPSPISEADKEELRQKLKAKRMECKANRAVFFGDAGFGATMKGHNAIPKKKILRELCHRGLTILLDEFKTSKMCPCGEFELKTTAGRVRSHQTNGSPCSFLCSSCDRDSLAAMNMLQCAVCAFQGKPRPTHLCRR